MLRRPFHIFRLPWGRASSRLSSAAVIGNRGKSAGTCKPLIKLSNLARVVAARYGGEQYRSAASRRPEMRRRIMAELRLAESMLPETGSTLPAGAKYSSAEIRLLNQPFALARGFAPVTVIGAKVM